MIRMRRLIAALSMVFVFGGSVVATIPQPAYACASAKFLTFPAWYDGLLVANPTDPSAPCGVDQSKDPKTFALKVAGNVVQIVLQLVGYISMGFIIYGGFLYMISTGDSSKLAGAKSTILNAVIGLVIAIFSTAIVNFVSERFVK